MLKIKLRSTLTTTLLSFIILSLVFLSACQNNKPPIKIGVLHSLTGTMAISEKGVVDAILMAVDEINQSGGLLDRNIKAIVIDGKSDPNIFAEQAHKLIKQDQVQALFACWTSRCRKALKPIVEKHQNLLFYPVQFEGFENSQHIIYAGASPNQQIIPSVRWVLENIGKKVYLLGSDYIYPRTANQIIRSMRDIKYSKNIQIVGEKYVALGEQNFHYVIEDILQQKPDVILNTINGDSNVAFFKQLENSHSAKTPHIPVMSFSLTENEIDVIGNKRMINHFVTSTYFQHLDNPANQEFIRQFKHRYGQHRKIGDAMVSAYVSVKLWAKSISTSLSSKPKQVRKALNHVSINGPSGILSIDEGTGHLWKTVYIGQFHPDGQFKTISSSTSAIKPQPYPKFYSKKEWHVIQDKINKELLP